MQDPLAGPSSLRDIVRPQFHQVNLTAESFVKDKLGVKLDKGLGSHLLLNDSTQLRGRRSDMPIGSYTVRVSSWSAALSTSPYTAVCPEFPAT